MSKGYVISATDLVTLIFLSKTAHREMFSESCSIKPIFDCNYTIYIILAPNRNLFGGKTIGKVKLQSKFRLIKENSETDYITPALPYYTTQDLYENTF